jgi:ADP-heptose:LPS heptosyltransferase
VSRPALLAYRPLGLGDLLTAVPALRALRDAFPRHRVVLAAPAALEPLARLSGAVDEVIDTAPLAEPALGGADIAVNLHGRGPQSHRALLATRPRRLIAFVPPGDARWRGRGDAGRPSGGDAGRHDGWFAGDRGPTWRAGEHEVSRWCRLLEESGIAADPARLDLDPPGGSPVPGATVVHPGAASAARRWPAERWAAVARAEQHAGRRVVVTGSAAERPLAERVARAAGLQPESVLAGRTGLLELAAVVAEAGLVLAGDTGVGHLATAFGVPSVLLFGPTPPSEWGPPPDRPQHVAIHTGGRGDPHGDAPDPALLAITVDDVLTVTRGVFAPAGHG